jgi:hypothetical protein
MILVTGLRSREPFSTRAFKTRLRSEISPLTLLMGACRGETGVRVLAHVQRSKVAEVDVPKIGNEVVLYPAAIELSRTALEVIAGEPPAECVFPVDGRSGPEGDASVLALAVCAFKIQVDEVRDGLRLAAIRAHVSLVLPASVIDADEPLPTPLIPVNLRSHRPLLDPGCALRAKQTIGQTGARTGAMGANSERKIESPV